MTGYRNFIEDFPRRCRDILDIAGKPALSRGREVTLILMVASTGFVVPYERLKPDSRWGDHPSGDRKRFADAAGRLESLLHQPFMSSRLWTETSSTWHGGKLDSVTGDPDSWEGLRKRRPISKDKQVGTILNVIRNAFAHGNIWTLRNPIEAIIFVKSVINDDEVVPDSSFVSVAPHEFRKFLENWFDFLNDFRIPQEVAFELLKDAA
jgi:hypothetical protein